MIHADNHITGDYALRSDPQERDQPILPRSLLAVPSSPHWYAIKKLLYVGFSCADTMADQEQLLTVNDLYLSFGGLVAVDKVSFELKPGEIVGLIGPNGADKTTTFNLLTGFNHPDRGEIVFNGKDITHASPHIRAQEGLIRTFQVARELSGMRVINNLLLGAQDNPGGAVFKNLALLKSSSSDRFSSETDGR